MGFVFLLCLTSDHSSCKNIPIGCISNGRLESIMEQEEFLSPRFIDVHTLFRSQVDTVDIFHTEVIGKNF